MCELDAVDEEVDPGQRKPELKRLSGSVFDGRGFTELANRIGEPELLSLRLGLTAELTRNPAEFTLNAVELTLTPPG